MEGTGSFKWATILSTVVAYLGPKKVRPARQEPEHRAAETVDVRPNINAMAVGQPARETMYSAVPIVSPIAVISPASSGSARKRAKPRSTYLQLALERENIRF